MRATVGLSRFNIEEADAVVGLVQWVVNCGTAPACITTISPYKVQDMTIIKKLS